MKPQGFTSLPFFHDSACRRQQDVNDILAGYGFHVITAVHLFPRPFPTMDNGVSSDRTFPTGSPCDLCHPSARTLPFRHYFYYPRSSIFERVGQQRRKWPFVLIRSLSFGFIPSNGDERSRFSIAVALLTRVSIDLISRAHLPRVHFSCATSA